MFFPGYIMINMDMDVEAKYFVRTLEMTTNEIKESRLLFPIENSWFNEWIVFLSLADQVKYAL